MAEEAIPMTTYADVPAKAIKYLDLPGAMANRIPRGDATLWAGEGQIGKGTSLVWMAVATALQGHHVVVVFPEDDPETAVRPRLDAALYALAGDMADDPEFVRGVLSRIHDMTVSEGGASFVLDATGKTAGSIAALTAFVMDPTGCGCPPDSGCGHPVVRLVIIDPLLACLEGSVNTNIGARRVMAPLMALAKDVGCALILSHHVVFVNGKPKVANSQGLTDAVRLCYIVQTDRYNAALRVVRVSKSNGVRPDDVRFALTTEPNGYRSVSWLDKDELAARRTAWRDEPEPVEDPNKAKVMAWLDAGGGSTAQCAEATGLDVETCKWLLTTLQAEGAVKPRRRLSLRKSG